MNHKTQHHQLLPSPLCPSNLQLIQLIQAINNYVFHMKVDSVCNLFLRNILNRLLIDYVDEDGDRCYPIENILFYVNSRGHIMITTERTVKSLLCRGWSGIKEFSLTDQYDVVTDSTSEFFFSDVIAIYEDCEEDGQGHQLFPVSVSKFQLMCKVSLGKKCAQNKYSNYHRNMENFECTGLGYVSNCNLCSWMVNAVIRMDHICTVMCDRLVCNF